MRISATPCESSPQGAVSGRAGAADHIRDSLLRLPFDEPVVVRQRREEHQDGFFRKMESDARRCEPTRLL